MCFVQILITSWSPLGDPSRFVNAALCWTLVSYMFAPPIPECVRQSKTGVRQCPAQFLILRFDSRRKQDLAPAAVQESDASLYIHHQFSFPLFHLQL